VSGLDTQSIISQLLEIERRPINNLERKVADLQAEQGRYTALQPLVSDLDRAASGLTDIASLDQPKVSNPNTTALGVSVTSDAIPSDYDLVVEQRAQAGRVASQGTEGSSATIAASGGTFSVRSGASGALISVEVDETTTLRDFTDAINAQNGDVRASIINDGTRENSARLVLTSAKTGREMDVEIVDNDTSLIFDSTTIENVVSDEANSSTYTGAVTSSGTYTGSDSKTFIVEIMSEGAVGDATYRFSTDGGMTFDDNGGAGYTTTEVASQVGNDGEGVELAFSDSGTLAQGDRFYIDVTSPVLRRAQDSVFTLNGISQTRSSNEVTDAIEGVTISLLEADPSRNLRFSVEQNDEGIVNAVEGLVDAYNELFSKIRDQQTFDSETNTGGPLLGDSTANSILRTMRRTLTTAAPGVEGGLRRLVDLGVRTTDGGRIELDRVELEGLLAENRNAVLDVLTSGATSPVDDLSLVSRPSGVPAGDYAVSITTAAERASVGGSAAFDTLTQDETLSFEMTGEANEGSPSQTTFSVDLAAGDTLAQAVAKLNSAFATQGVAFEAQDDGGTLRIASRDFGSNWELSVSSSVAAGAGTSQIGTAQLDGQGVDVVGTVDGETIRGSGATLSVGEGVLEGVVLEYTGSATGFLGNLSLTTGLGELFAETSDALSGEQSSTINTKNDSINDQIERLRDQIARKEESLLRTQERLEREYANLETTMAELQSQQTFLTNQLAQLG